MAGESEPITGLTAYKREVLRMSNHTTVCIAMDAHEANFTFYTPAEEETPGNARQQQRIIRWQ